MDARASTHLSSWYWLWDFNFQVVWICETWVTGPSVSLDVFLATSPQWAPGVFLAPFLLPRVFFVLFLHNVQFVKCFPLLPGFLPDQLLLLLQLLFLRSGWGEWRSQLLRNDSFKPDLHRTILSHATSFTTRLWHEKRCRILKHVLKPFDNRVLKSVGKRVVRRLHVSKSYRVNRSLEISGEATGWNKLDLFDGKSWFYETHIVTKHHRKVPLRYTNFLTDK